MSGKKKIILGLIVAVILVAASVSVVAIIQMQQDESSEENYQKAQEYLAEDEPLKALGPLHRAANAAELDAPEKELQYRLEAARLALEFRRAMVVESHAKRLWDGLNRRDEEILFMLLAVSNKPMEENLEYGLELIEQMPDTANKADARSKVYLRFDKLSEARDILEELYAQKPSMELIGNLSRTYLRLNEIDKAVELFNANRETGLLGVYGYQTLAEIMALQDNVEEANAVYEEAKQNNKYTDVMQFRQAITYLSNSKFNEARKLFNGIINPYRLGVTNRETESFIEIRKIKEFINLFKEGTDPFVAKLLPDLHPKTKAMIAEFDPDETSIDPLFAAFVIDFNRIMAEGSLYDEKLFPDKDKLLEKTRELLSIPSPSADELFELNRYLLTEGFKEYVNLPEPRYISGQARLFLSVLVGQKNIGGNRAEAPEEDAQPVTPEEVTADKEIMLEERLEEIGRLEKMAVGTRHWLEGERFFYQYLRKRLNFEEDAYETLMKAYKLLENHPAVIVQVAREHTIKKEYGEAISAYEKLIGADRVYARGQLVQFEIALALARDGNYERSLGIISRLHKRKFITRATLELFRDLSERLQIPDASNLAQSILQKVYKDDPKIEYQGAMMNLRAGEYEKAFENFDNLYKQFPDNQEFEYIRLAAMLGTGDYNRVLEECDKSNLPQERMAGIRADALENLQRYSEALAAYKKAVESPDIPSIFRVRYGRLLLTRGEEEKGVVQLEAVLEKEPNHILANIGMASVAMQNKEYGKAREHINLVLKNGGDDIAEAYQLLAEADIAENKIESAATNCHLAMKVDPRNIRNRYLLGKIQNRKGDFKEAQRNLRAYIKEVPNDVDALFQIVSSMGALKQYDGALMVVNTLIEGNPQSLQLRQIQLSLLLGAKRSEDAQKVLDIVKASITEIQALRYSAQIREISEDLPGAIALLQTRLVDPGIALYWADLKLKQKSPEGVMEVVKKHNYKPMELGSLAVTADQNGFLDLSSDLYEIALELNPEGITWLNNYAWANLRSNKVNQEKVMASILKAKELSPNNITIIDTYAAVLKAFNKNEESIKMLTSSINLTLSSKRLVYYLASAYEDAGEVQKALEYYKRCKNMKGALSDLSVTDEDLDAKVTELKDKVKELNSKGE